MKYGSCCSCYRYGEFKKLNRDFWLEEMIRNSRELCGEEAGDKQCRAWLNCREVMNKALKKLPGSYEDVFLVFEYLLPNHKPGTKKAETEKGIRPDVLMVSKEHVIVLEFKQRKADGDGSVFEGYANQAEKYVRRLNRYHKASENMVVMPVLVMVLEHKLLEDRDSIIVCSADRLAEAIVTLSGETPVPFTDSEMAAWLDSEIG